MVPTQSPKDIDVNSCEEDDEDLMKDLVDKYKSKKGTFRVVLYYILYDFMCFYSF